MKVLHVIPSLGPLRGGPSFSLSSIAKGLAQAGVSVDIATTDDNGPDRLDVALNKPIVEEGVTTWYFPRQTRFYNASWPLTRWLAGHIGEYDVVHTHALFSYSSTVSAWLAAKHQVPYIVEPLGALNRWGMMNCRPRLKQASYRLVERRILAGAAAVRHTCQQERQEAAEAGGDGRSVVIPLGIDVSAFRHLPPPDRFLAAHPILAGRKIILFLSRLDAKKGLDILLEAFAQVLRPHPDAALVIAGNGDLSFISRLQSEAKALGISSQVTWPGFLAGDDKLAAMSAATLFVLPSYSENFGIAAVEALAAGLPVVLSDQVGIAPEVEASQAGLIVPPDAHSLTAALDRLLLDSDLRQSLIHNANRLVDERFSLDAMTRRLVALYGEVIERREATPSCGRHLK